MLITFFVLHTEYTDLVICVVFGPGYVDSEPGVLNPNGLDIGHKVIRMFLGLECEDLLTAPCIFMRFQVQGGRFQRLGRDLRMFFRSVYEGLMPRQRSFIV